MTVRLSGTLPRERQDNGLNTTEVEQRVAADPSKPLVAVIILHPATKATDLDGGKVTWTVKAAQVEVLDPESQGDTLREALKLLGQAREDRTGEPPIDFEAVTPDHPWGDDE